MKILPNVCFENLAESKAFYVEFISLNVKYDSD